MMNNGPVDDMKEFHKDNTVHFVIKLKEEVDKLDILKVFKLTSSISANNLVLFDQNLHIKKYQDEIEILDEYF